MVLCLKGSKASAVMFGAVKILLKLWKTHIQEWLIMNTVYPIHIMASLEFFETFVENKTTVLFTGGGRRSPAV